MLKSIEVDSYKNKATVKKETVASFHFMMQWCLILGMKVRKVQRNFETETLGVE